MRFSACTLCDSMSFALTFIGWQVLCLLRNGARNGNPMHLYTAGHCFCRQRSIHPCAPLQQVRVEGDDSNIERAGLADGAPGANRIVFHRNCFGIMLIWRAATMQSRSSNSAFAPELPRGAIFAYELGKA